MTKPPLQVLLCAPRGFCAGVIRAIDAVEQALSIYGPPVYVRHEIVHNKYVVESLKKKGAIFVEELDEIPSTDAPVIFSAHGVPKAIPLEASARRFFAIDATCPLVTKVHREAELHYRRGHTIILVGHAGHPEVVGTLGQLPDGAVILVENIADVHRLADEASPEFLARKLAFVTQTTLSVDDTQGIVETLKLRFRPHGGCAAGGGFGQFVELAALEGGVGARRLPQQPARAQGVGHRLGAAGRHPQDRHHGRRFRAGGAGRGDHRRLRGALHDRGRDGGDRHRNHVLPAAARAARRSGADGGFRGALIRGVLRRRDPREG